MLAERRRSVQRLLLMSCGSRKRPDTMPLPALERYDGPSFRVLRRYLATHPVAPPDVYILSARYGLIPTDQPIPYYDQRLTPQRATEPEAAVRDMLARILARREFEQIYLAVGRDYARALDGSTEFMPAAASVVAAEGSQGKRPAQLHDWLYGPAVPIAPQAAETRRMVNRRGKPQRRGVGKTLTADRARKPGRRAGRS